MAEDVFHTIPGPSEGFFKDKGSKFYAYAFPVISTKEIQDYLDQVKKNHPKARHACYAWRLGVDGNNYRSNDDGEPSGTAGRPILGQIDSFGLTDVFIVVIRYFGGTLLGTSGLIQAYRESAADALKNAEKVEKYLSDYISLGFEYSQMSDVMNVMKKFDLSPQSQSFDLHPEMQVIIRKRDTASFLHLLKAHLANVSMEEAEGLDIKNLIKLQYL
ncbi:MAG: YigZ family protein [Saprospiraceae bacterium]|nr:YigZ family protein [Saprospiraceae bacterium]